MPEHHRKSRFYKRNGQKQLSSVFEKKTTYTRIPPNTLVIEREYMDFGKERKRKIYVHEGVERVSLASWAKAGKIVADCYVGANTAHSRAWEKAYQRQ